jgi:hypothetical protein
MRRAHEEVNLICWRGILAWIELVEIGEGTRLMTLLLVVGVERTMVLQRARSVFSVNVASGAGASRAELWQREWINYRIV